MSGYDPAHAAESDAGVLLAAMGEPVTEESIARIAPWRFAAPLSPDMAAAREDRAIDFGELVQFSRDGDRARRKTRCSSKASAASWCRSMTRHTVLDWMAELAVPLIMVTGSYLGTHQPYVDCARGRARAPPRCRRARRERKRKQHGAACRHRHNPGAPLPGTPSLPSLAGPTAPMRSPASRAPAALTGSRPPL